MTSIAICKHTRECSYRCGECSKCFAFQSSLRLHMRIHTGEKQYNCNFYEKSFRQKYSNHTAVHTGEKSH